MNRLQKILNSFIWIVIAVLGIYILGYGVKGKSFSKAAYACGRILMNVEESLQRTAAKSLYPGLGFVAGERKLSSGFEEFLIQNAVKILPVFTFVEQQELYETETESMAAYEILISGGIHDENEINTQTGEAFDLIQLMEEENYQVVKAEELADVSVEQDRDFPGIEYTSEQLSDFEFVRNSFYIVENNTDIGPEVLNAVALLEKDMSIQGDNTSPQILIYHTHSQEGFVDSIPGDNNTTIVGVGAYLAEILRETYGYNVIHNTNVYDFINGKLDRNQAYALAEVDVERILAENPTIEVVIDLHRDGVNENTHLVTEVNGTSAAQLMFFNGLSYSKRNGPIGYLPNPYVSENLAMSLQMKLACEKYYPGLSRKIYLKSLRYNLHLSPKALLVEAGAQTNTLEEMKNAMAPLAFVLHQVLH